MSLLIEVIQRLYSSDQNYNYNSCQVHKAQDVATKRGKLLTEDFLYLIRKVIFCKMYTCHFLMFVRSEMIGIYLLGTYHRIHLWFSC